MEGMASQNAQQSFPHADNRTVFFDGLYEVLATRWFEATVFSQQRPNRQLIKSDTTDQSKAWQFGKPLQVRHGRALPSRSDRSIRFNSR